LKGVIEGENDGEKFFEVSIRPSSWTQGRATPWQRATSSV